AGAGTAAFRLDTRDVVLDRGLHHRRADFGFDGAGGTGGIDIGDLNHGGRQEKSPAGRPSGLYLTGWPRGRQCAPHRTYAWQSQRDRNRRAISLQVSATAAPSASTAAGSSRSAACSTASAARATRQAPIPSAEPFMVWASVAAAGRAAARMRGSN